jgi:hypothetical protein
MAPPSDLIASASMGPAPMTLVKLSGKNYVYWSRYVEVYLRGKGLFSHWNPDNLRMIAPRAFGTKLTIKLYLLC